MGFDPCFPTLFLSRFSAFLGLIFSRSRQGVPVENPAEGWWQWENFCYPEHKKLLIPILLSKLQHSQAGITSQGSAAHSPGVGAAHPAEPCPGSRAPRSSLCLLCSSGLSWAVNSRLVLENSLEFSILESKLELLILLQAVVAPHSWICASF